MPVDSHALLWFLAGEVGIKTALRKLDAPDDLPDRVLDFGFDLLPITAEHGWRVRHLAGITYSL